LPKNFHETFKHAWRFHELKAFIGQAFKGAAVLGYRKALITPPMRASGSPAGGKVFGGF
jgi:hypothetical protein